MANTSSSINTTSKNSNNNTPNGQKLKSPSLSNYSGKNTHKNKNKSKHPIKINQPIKTQKKHRQNPKDSSQENSTLSTKNLNKN